MGQVAERAINTVIDMASAILMQDWMICHKDTLSIDFGQRKWTMPHESKVGFLISNMEDTLSIDFGQRKWTMLYVSKVGFLIGSMV